MELNTLKEPKLNALIIEANELEIRKYQTWLQDAREPLKERIVKMIQRLTEENERLSRRSEAVENAIADSIDDLEVIEMIRLFQRGKSWQEINLAVYGYPDYQACRKRCERAVQKIDFE